MNCKNSKIERLARYNEYQRTVLQVIDRILGAIVLLGSLPLILVVAVIIAIRSRQSPLVAHLRAGQFGTPFWMLKFRTMWDPYQPALGRTVVTYVNNGRLESKERNDARVTDRFARFCRKYSLDELPQFAHVVSGKMSLVGPRPITACELATYYGDDAREVLQVKPGITGLWQVKGRSKLTYAQRRRLDLFFVRHLSPGLYFRVLALTISRAVSGENAW